MTTDSIATVDPDGLTIMRRPEPLPRTLRIRLHDKRGHYPARSVYGPDARLISRDGLIFSAVLVELQENHGITAELYSEQVYLALEEIRFFASISMSLNPEHGVFYTYPLALAMRDLPPDAHEASVMKTAHELAAKHIWPATEYPMHSESADPELVAAFVNQIDLTDHLLMNGLGALVGAQMLATHPEFMQAATSMLHVAMEASFSLILRRLKATGKNNPSSADAGTYLAEIFDEVGIPHLEGYFPEYYEDRIKTVHPANRFGVFPYPPLDADDYYFLRNGLTEVFAFLCIGHKWPKDVRR